MEKKNTNLTLKKVKDLGGKIFEVKEGRTSSTILNKLLSIQNLKVEDNVNLIVLNFTNCSKIQAIFEILNMEDENSPLKEIYTTSW